MRGRIEAVLDFARVQGWRQDDGRINPAAWKGNLALTLPAKNQGACGQAPRRPGLA